MPAPSALAPPASRSPQGQNAKNVVPFIRSTKKHREPFFDFTVPSGGATNPGTALSPINIPAYGFLRGIWIRVDATGATGATSLVLQNDAPWNIFQFMGLFDVNGAPLFGPFSSSYKAYLIAKYGAYHRYFDGFSADFVSPTQANGGNGRWWFYIPVEMIRRNGMGSLANLNAAATYKLQLTTASTAQTYSGGTFTAAPAIRIRCWIDAWAQPPATDLLGNMTAQTPINHGTTQFWSEQVYPIGAGQQTVRLVRTGLFIRELICTLNLSTGLRDTTDTDWADPVQLFLDGFELVNVSQNFLWTELHSLYNLTPNGAAAGGAAGTRDVGVYVFQFVDDDSAVLGNEERNRYLPTLQSSRLEIRGAFAGSAAQLSVLTNDIAPQGDIFVGSVDNATI
jgi:hypothetical protein